ncbi:hypothetical protein [uncultured Tateyamaria sp.]|uniref:hypothetical protein n=1 Tax=uncultured Tateyamaria sp. TaxID=455651 RepID=UPI00263377D6|nr:hypothetical protein [uncultured Tateyamaria sp.]
MRKTTTSPAEKIVKDIKRATRKQNSRLRTHDQNMTVAARAIADKKTLGHR